MRTYQRGIAALALSLILLFAMTMAALFTHRSMVVEQHSAANQLRAAQAFEWAEAGRAWGEARLNDPHTLAAAPSCEAEAGQPERFLQRAFTMHAVCARATPDAALRCTCGPSATQVDAPGFEVRFEPAVPAGDGAIVLTARGCTRLSNCLNEAPAGTLLEASATVQSTLQPLAALRRSPGAAVTAGGSTRVGEGVSLHNDDAITRGMTVIAGGTVTHAASAAFTTLAGTPPSASVVEGDPALAAMLAKGSVFKAHFGVDPADFKRDPRSRVITRGDCDSASACGALVAREVSAGYRQFWIGPDVELPALEPSGAETLVLVTEGAVVLASPAPLHALLVGMGQTTRIQSRGAATLKGAIVAQAGLSLEAPGLQVIFQPSIVGKRYIPVPGRWQDQAIQP